MAARARAPLGSATRRDRSAASRTAAAISASLTVTIPSRWARRCANVRRPSACVRVPSAIVRDTSAGGPTDDLATLERIARIGGELGFHADDPRARDERLDRHRDTTRESAAADRHEDQRDIRQVLGDLESDRALPGDDPIVVVRRDDGETPFRGDRLGPFPAFLRGRSPR